MCIKGGMLSKNKLEPYAFCHNDEFISKKCAMAHVNTPAIVKTLIMLNKTLSKHVTPPNLHTLNDVTCLQICENEWIHVRETSKGEIYTRIPQKIMLSV